MRTLRIAVGFVVFALILLAVALYLSTYYVKQEQQLASKGDLQGALEKAQMAARLNPFDSTPLVARSNVLQQQGQPEAAAEALRDAIERDPAKYSNLVSLANLQMNRLDDPEGAVKNYREALKKIPKDTSLAFTLAQAYTTVGDLESAKREYEKLLEMRRISPRGLFNLGRIYVRMGEPEKGVEVLRKASTRVSASLESADEGAKKKQREAFVRSVDLAIVDALVVEGRYDEARAMLQESDFEQASAILELLNTDPESYRQAVLSSEV